MSPRQPHGMTAELGHSVMYWRSNFLKSECVLRDHYHPQTAADASVPREAAARVDGMDDRQVLGARLGRGRHGGRNLQREAGARAQVIVAHAGMDRLQP